MTPPRTATAPHIEIGTQPIPAKNPRGRPRKYGLPAASVPKKPKTSRRARADTPTEIQGQPEKRGPGRPPKDKSLNTQNASAKSSSSNPSPPMNPIPSRGPQEGTATVSATEETSNIQITVTTSSDVTVRCSEETDISEQRVRETLRFHEEAEENQRLGLAVSQWKRQREDDALDFELFKYNHEHDVEPNRKRIAFADEEDEEAEQEIGTEESKRKAERRRQRRECRDYGCYDEDCRISHAVRANVARYMENLDERTEALRTVVVKTDDEVMEEGTRPMIFDYPWLIAR